MLKKTEHFEPLGNNIKIIVSDIHRFSTDTILLSHFSSPKKSDKVVELGCGCGTIPLLMKKDGKASEITAVEIQPDACDMLKRSIELNSLSGVTVLNSDLKDLKGKLPFGYYNLVVCNPPYKEAGTGIYNPNIGKKTARHETLCTMEDIVSVASRLLNFGGRFCMCQRPERLTDAMQIFRKNNLEPKRLRLVQQRISKPPKLFLLEGRKGGKRGFMTVEPTLFIENASGDFSQEMLDIYGDYKS
ncbi:MAG: tRNA1(Val) (adenine(37)-N6)-methyltransferase [Ruminococcus sp.]|nr:tRNA1(Val) (adenine(37)-N6)-methyltransferase [Ruminococcus sp.]